MKVLSFSLAFLSLASGCVIERSADYTACVASNCPNEADACTIQLPDDNCADFQESCKVLTAECCAGMCGTELSDLLACTLPFCEGGFDCGAAPAADSPQADEGFGSCLFESVALYSDCVVENCADTADGCTLQLPDDNCEQFQESCKTLTAECCPECGDQLAVLLNCALGFCPEFDTCSAPAADEYGGDNVEADCVSCLLQPAANCEEVCASSAEGDAPASACIACLTNPAINDESCGGCGGETSADTPKSQCIDCLVGLDNCEEQCAEAFGLGTATTETPPETTGATTEDDYGGANVEKACIECLLDPAANCEEVCAASAEGDAPASACIACLTNPKVDDSSCGECGGETSADTPESKCVQCLVTSEGCETQCKEAFGIDDPAGDDYGGDKVEADCVECLLKPAANCEEVCASSAEGDAPASACIACLTNPKVDDSSCGGCGGETSADTAESKCIECLVTSEGCETQCKEAFKIMDENTNTTDTTAMPPMDDSSGGYAVSTFPLALGVLYVAATVFGM